MSHGDDDDENNIPPPPPHARAGLSLRTHVRKMQNFDSALDALGAYDSLSRGSYATRERPLAPRMLESSARLRLADAVQSDEDAKTAMMNVLLLVVLFDAMGIFLMTPVTPRIYNEAPAGTSQFARDSGVGAFAGEARSFPLGGLSAAFQYGQICNQLAVAVANFLSGYLSKVIGRKNALLVYTFGGGVASVLASAAGWQGWSMYTYWGMRALMGLFGGSQPVANMYIAEMYADADPATKQKKLMAPMQMTILAVLLGPLVGMAVVASDLVFLPLTIGGALEFVACFLVMRKVPHTMPALKQANFVHPKKKDDDDIEGGMKKESFAKDSSMSKAFLVWVAVFWAARLADRAALGQFQYLQTVGVKRWGNVAIELLPVVIVILSILGVIIMPYVMKLNARVGSAYTGVIGQGIAGTMFFALAEMNNFYAFSGVVFVLQCFTMMATVLVTPTIIALVPAASRDMWLGYQTGITQVMTALAPLMVNPVLDRELSGEVAGGTFLRLNGIICLASAALYLALTMKLGIPRKVTPEMKEAEEAMKDYEETGETRNLTADQFTSVIRKKMEAGEAIPLAKWTTYEEDVAYYGRGLEKMKKAAHQDFADGRKRLPLRIQTFREAQEDPEKMKKYVAALQTLQDQGFTRWTDEHKRKIGQWFGDYLESNGYMNPSVNQRLFKTVVMNAFPQLGDGKACDTWDGYIANPIPVWLKIDAWMAGHMKLKRMTDKDFEAYKRLCLSTLLLPGQS
ncbi:hypothetical protein NFJ02_01g35660 [Pycnococcus provasolii]